MNNKQLENRKRIEFLKTEINRLKMWFKTSTRPELMRLEKEHNRLLGEYRNELKQLVQSGGFDPLKQPLNAPINT